MKPLIGLTPTPEQKEMERGTFRLHTLNDYYSRSVIAAGGIPVMLPSNIKDIDELLNHLDGVVMTGGGDINPDLYAQAQHDKTEGVDAERDAFEHAIVHAAIKRDLPLLGICRGLQMLNVALGGTLHQDIDDRADGATEHRQQKEKRHHEELFQIAILAEGNNPLRDLTSSRSLPINSFHHQCIRDLAESLEVMARSEDGLVEAVYNPGMTFCLAVQWHPEMLQHQHAEHATVFTSLVDAANAYQCRRINREVHEPV